MSEHTNSSNSKVKLSTLSQERYQKILRRAAVRMRHERKNHTLGVDGLVSEAVLRLAAADQTFDNSAHFMRVIEVAMRHVLIDYARNKAQLKRGGGRKQTPMHEDAVGEAKSRTSLTRRELREHGQEALVKLHQTLPKAHDAFVLCKLSGFTVPRAAQSLGVSISTIDKRVASANAFLRGELKKHEPNG